MTFSRIDAISNIFSVLGGTSEVARALGVRVSTASEMKRRGRIPAEYWHDVIRVARERAHPEIDADLLVRLHARDLGAERPRGFGEEDAPAFQGPGAASGQPARSEGTTGHFSRHKTARRARFMTAEEVEDHIRALREEWSHR